MGGVEEGLGSGDVRDGGAGTVGVEGGMMRGVEWGTRRESERRLSSGMVMGDGKVAEP